MEDKNYNQNFEEFQAQAAVMVDEAGLSRFLTRVFAWMVLGLVFTAGISHVVMSNTELLRFVAGNWTVLILVQLALVWICSSSMASMNPMKATIAFFVYAGFNGLIVGPIVSLYTGASVVAVFAITAATFAVMAVYGFVTKKDLTKMGSMLMMVLLGCLIAGLINLFILQSGVMSLIMSCLLVFVFVGLIAYDAQTIRSYYNPETSETSEGQSLAIVGAFTLYLDMIGLFLNLLRLFGDRE